MSENRTNAPFRVGYIDYVPHPAFLEKAGADPALEIVRIPANQPEDAILAALAECDGYYVMASRDELAKSFHVTDALLAKLPRLLIAASYGAGYDTIDPEAGTRAGVLVVNQAGGNAEAVSEHAVGMMLALLKRFPECHDAMKAGRAQDRAALKGRDLLGKTVGLFGLGNVGTRVSEILRLAFRCRILACDPYVDAEAMRARGAEKVDKATLLATADVVSIHCPLTAETRGMIDAEAFAAMKQDAIFVTTARGSIHVEAALQDALDSGRLAGAGVDVWDLEPPPVDHPLLHHPRVICTQHTAGVTEESRRLITSIAAQAFSDVAAARMPPRIINPAVIPRFADRYRSARGRAIA